jgi:hypothetical protein
MHFFGGRAFYLRDLHLRWFGQIESFVRAIAAGSGRCGTRTYGSASDAANANAQVLYRSPGSAVMRPPLHRSTSSLHLLWAGLGTSALA